MIKRTLLILSLAGCAALPFVAARAAVSPIDMSIGQGPWSARLLVDNRVELILGRDETELTDTYWPSQPLWPFSSRWVTPSNRPWSYPLFRHIGMGIYDQGSGSRVFDLNVSMVAMWAMLGTYPVLYIGLGLFRSWRRRHPWQCRRCGYDVRGCAKQRCSECGEPFSGTPGLVDDPLKHPRRFPWRRGVLGLLIIAWSLVFLQTYVKHNRNERCVECGQFRAQTYHGFRARNTLESRPKASSRPDVPNVRILSCESTKDAHLPFLPSILDPDGTCRHHWACRSSYESTLRGWHSIIGMQLLMKRFNSCGGIRFEYEDPALLGAWLGDNPELQKEVRALLPNEGHILMRLTRKYREYCDPYGNEGTSVTLDPE